MSLNLNSEYWNERYLTNNFGWDLGEISPPLKNYFNQITDKNLSILIPGAGNAYEAEYLVTQGFKNIYVCDFAPEPLKALKARCKQINEDHLLFGDFFEIKNISFDIIIEQTFFCALNPNLRKKYFEKMHELLKPKGQLVGLLFDDKLNDDQPPFGGNKEEYLSYFQHLLRIHTYEKCYNSIKPREGRELFINLVRM
jgi:thiopurine S-methyltransferase